VRLAAIEPELSARLVGERERRRQGEESEREEESL
jgi:hypothetical protein